MSGVELILAALAAGAAAGGTDAVKTAVVDAYTALRGALHGRLSGERARQALNASEAELPGWRAELTAELERSGAAADQDVLISAQRVLALTDPDGAAAGKYRIEVNGGGHLHAGDTTIQAPNNQGAIGTFHAPVSFGAPSSPRHGRE